jgi:hypothetical protein
VRVGFVSPAIGYGLFAARDFAKDEFIFHEAPMMTALFNEKFSADKNLMQSQVRSYRAVLAGPSRDVATVAFPALAARTGIAPAPFEEAADILASPAEMGRYLVHGRFAGSTVTREQYLSYTSRLPVAAAPSEKDVREACLEFFKQYAFDVRRAAGAGVGTAAAAAAAAVPGAGAGAATHRACIYLLGSLINHCCTPQSTGASTTSISCSGLIKSTSTSSAKSSSSRSSSSSKGPNCSWRIGPSGLAHFVKPRHICVQARRAIREGEQLTWDYGKREKGFECECDTCRSSGWFGPGLGNLGYLCTVL